MSSTFSIQGRLKSSASSARKLPCLKEYPLEEAVVFNSSPPPSPSDVATFYNVESIDAPPTTSTHLDCDLWDWSCDEAEIDKGSRQLPKRRKFGRSHACFVSRLAAFSRRLRDRGASQGLAIQTSGIPMSSHSPYLAESTRPTIDKNESWLPPTPARSASDRAEGMAQCLQADSCVPGAEPIDRKTLSSTPLLPPNMLDLMTAENTPTPSPLQSPRIAGSFVNLSAANTPTGTMQTSNLPTPPLSSKPSYSSIYRALPKPASDSRNMVIPDPSDEWAIKLGHADFTIEPAPYLAASNPDSMRIFLADWDHARTNFSRHLARTIEHYGTGSETYQLTKQKWAAIDTEWRSYHENAVSAVADTEGEMLSEVSPLSPPGPELGLPTLHDFIARGKFPMLGDGDVVGPMVQSPSQTPTRRLSKEAVLKFLGFG